MNELQELIEKNAQKMFGGAEVKVEPFKNPVMTGWDVSITPHIDKGLRFIRVSEADGIPRVMEYMKRIQQNLLQLQQSGAFGMNLPLEVPSEEAVVEAIKQKMPEEGFKCENCNYLTKYPGIFAIHKKKCTKQEIQEPALNKSARAINESGIYEISE